MARLEVFKHRYLVPGGTETVSISGFGSGDACPGPSASPRRQVKLDYGRMSLLLGGRYSTEGLEVIREDNLEYLLLPTVKQPRASKAPTLAPSLLAMMALKIDQTIFMDYQGAPRVIHYGYPPMPVRTWGIST